MDETKLIDALFAKGILINKEILTQKLDDKVLGKIESEADLLVLTSDYVDVIHQQSRLIDWYDIDRYRVDAEKDRDEDLYQRQLQEFKNVSLELKDVSLPLEKSVSSLEVAVDASFNQGSFVTEARGEETTELLPSVEEPLILTRSAVTIILSYVNTPRKYTV